MRRRNPMPARRRSERDSDGGDHRPAAPDAAPCELRLVTDRAAFDALEADWNDLFERAGRGTQVFQTFNWNWHWCNHYLATPSVRRGFPLARDRHRTPRRPARHGLAARRWCASPVCSTLVWMGDPVSQYGDVLIEDGPDAEALLREAWSFITAQLEAGPRLAAQGARRRGRSRRCLAELGAVATQRLAAPYLDLARAGDFAAYEQRYSPRSRKKQRAMARAPRRAGPRGASSDARAAAQARELRKRGHRIEARAG